MTPLATMVEGLLLKGCTRHLIEAAIEKEWTGEPRPTGAEIDGAYAECVDAWVGNASEESGSVHAYHIRARKFLYQKSLVINDYKTALSILKDLAKLEKAYEHQRKKIQEAEEEQSEEGHYLRLIHGKESADNDRARKATGQRPRH
jgi:hypothetical protein